MAFKVLCVDHVGVAVKDLQAIKQQMKDILGLDPSLPDETVEEQHVTTSFFKPSAQTEACELEFLGSTTPDGPIARFIEKAPVMEKLKEAYEKANGGKNGFQHVALRVDDIEACLADLQAKEVPLIDKKYRIGAGGCHIAFLHPKATGLLLELTERPGGPSFKA